MAVVRIEAAKRWHSQMEQIARGAGYRRIAREFHRAAMRAEGRRVSLAELTTEEVRALAEILPADPKIAQAVADADAGELADEETRERLRLIKSTWPSAADRSLEDAR